MWAFIGGVVVGEVLMLWAISLMEAGHDDHDNE